MLIGLTGYAGSGKDTVADILVREHGFVRYAFADKLREFVYAQNPLVNDRGYTLRDYVDAEGWDSAKRRIPEVRRILQDTGVWVRDNLGEDTWVRLVKDQITHEQLTAGVVVTDVRFPNEHRFINSWGGLTLRVERNGVGPANDHISEQPTFEPDGFIWNNGTLQDLSVHVDEWVRHMRGRS